MKRKVIDKYGNIIEVEYDEEQKQYKEVKEERIKLSLPKAKIDPNNISTASNIISIAPKKNTPRFDMNEFISNIKQQSVLKKGIEGASNMFNENKSLLKKGIEGASNMFNENKSLLEKGGQGVVRQLGANKDILSDGIKGISKFGTTTVSRVLDIPSKALQITEVANYNKYKPVIYNTFETIKKISKSDDGKGRIEGVLGLFKDGIINNTKDTLNPLSLAEKTVPFSKIVSPVISEGYKELTGQKKQEDETDKIVNYVLGTKSVLDTIDYRTANEKRQDILSKYTPQEQEELKKYDSIAIGVDVINGIASGLLTGTAITAKIASLGPTAPKYLKILDKTLNPSFSNLAKGGAIFGALATTYYGLTGKWVFDEGDVGANEGAGILLGSLGLKLGFGGFMNLGKGSNYIKSLFSNNEFVKGVSSFNKNLVEELEKPEFIKLTSEERNIAYKALKELEIQQQLKSKKGTFLRNKLEGDLQDLERKDYYDKEGFKVKEENIKKLQGFGLINEDGSFNIDTIKENFYTFEKSFPYLGKGFHIDYMKQSTITKEGGLSNKSVEEMHKIMNEQAEAEMKKGNNSSIFSVKKTTEEMKKQASYNPKISDFSNYVNYYINKGKGMFFRDVFKMQFGELAGDENAWSIKGFFNGADRTVFKNISSAMSIRNRVTSMAKNFQKLANAFNGDVEGFKEFVNYINVKSRYQQTINQELLFQKEYEGVINNFSTNKIKIDEINEEIDKLSLELSGKNNKKDISSIKNKIFNLKKEKDKYYKNINDLEKNIDNILNDENFSSLEEEKIYYDIFSKQSKVDEINDNISKLKYEISKEKDKNKIISLSNKINSLTNKRREIIKNINILEKSLNELESKKIQNPFIKDDLGLKINLYDEEISGIDLTIKNLKELLYKKTDKKEISSLYKQINNLTNKRRELYIKNKKIEKYGEIISKRTFSTTLKDKDGNVYNFSKNDMKRIIDDGDGKYGELANIVYGANREILELEKQKGLLSEETINKFMKDNPFYIPAVLEEDYKEILLNSRKLNITGGATGYKTLKEGSKTMQFSFNSLENTFQQFAMRINMVARTEEINKLINFGENLGITAKYVEGTTPPKGYSLMPYIKNGETEYAVVPIFYKEASKKFDYETLRSFTNLINIINQIGTSQITGILNPVFALKTLLYEPINGLVASITQGRGIKHIASLIRPFGGDLAKTQEGRAVLREIARRSGQGFGIATDLVGDISRRDEILLGNGVKKKFKEGVRLLENVMNSVEIYSTRFPAWRASMKAMGLNSKTLDDAIKYGKTTLDDGYSEINIEKVISYLENKGISPNIAGVDGRSIFDFLSVNNSIRKISKILPYIVNIPLLTAKATKKTFEDNPLTFFAILSAYYIGAEIMASYNSGTESVFLKTLKENIKQKELFDKQEEDVKFRTGLLTFGKDENGDDEYGFFSLGKNMTLFEPMYAIAMSQKLRGEDVKISDMFNRTAQSFIPFIDLGEFGGINWVNALPPFAKPFVEIGLNKNTQYGNELVPSEKIIKDDKGNTMWTIAYNPKTTSKTSIYITRGIALLSGGELRKDGNIYGGKQISPAHLDRALDVFDKGLLRGFIDKIYYYSKKGDKTATSTYVKKFNNLLTIGLTKHTSNTLDKDIFKADGKSLEEKVATRFITDEIKKAKLSEVDGIIKKSVEFYGIDEGYIRQNDIIKNLIKDKAIEENFGDNAVYISKLNSRDLADYIFHQPNEEAKKEKLLQITNMLKNGVLSQDKVKDMLFELRLLKQKKD